MSPKASLIPAPGVRRPRYSRSRLSNKAQAMVTRRRRRRRNIDAASNHNNAHPKGNDEERYVQVEKVKEGLKLPETDGKTN